MSARDVGGMVIRTPDQRLRVFVSSTLVELADERAVVARSITSLGLAPVMFELGARPHAPQELYRAYLAQSDVFIGLYWESYGWVGPGMEISGLEDEFRLSGDRPRLLYLKAPAPDRHPQLSAMIDEIRNNGTDAYRTFRSARELGRLVRDDLALLLSERFVSSQRLLPPDDSPAVTPRRNARRTLPVTSTSLIGRSAEVAAVVDLLRQPAVRLVNLTGPGGIGKTRLAIAVGEAFAADGPSAVSFVSLAAVERHADVLSRVTAALGVIVEGARSASDALVEHFGEDDVLLILDNLEQVIAVAPQLDDLLTRCPGLKLLTTSRIALRLRAEHEYVLSALGTGEDSDVLSAAKTIALPAVRLFLDRAEAVRRGVGTTPEQIAAVREICRRLDGVPLAIELAAARTRLLDPPALLSRLENVLDTLGTGPIDLPERQRTLRATVEWSVGLLRDADRRTLALLSAFVDGWTLSASSAIAETDEEDMLDVLDTLVAQSLVSVDASRSEPRFRMLTSVREFAAELLSEHDRQSVQLRHAEYFAHLAESEIVAEQLIEWTDRLRADDDNLRAALRWFFENDMTRLPHLLRTLWLYWQIHDRMPEGRAWANELHRRVGIDTLDERARAELLFTTAVTATEVGEDMSAMSSLDDIQDVLTGMADVEMRNLLLLAASWVLPLRGEVTGALEAAKAAYGGFAAQRDPFVASAALTVGMLEMSVGDDASARQHLTEVDTLGSRFGIQWLTLSARTHLALIAVRAGDHQNARQQIRRALSGLDDTRVTTLSACLLLAAFGYVTTAEGKPELAVTALGSMDGLRERAGVSSWPNSRRTEAVLRDLVSGQVSTSDWASAYTAGRAMRLVDALALIRRAVDFDAAQP
ncbi:DUF4062 domain-containing protein [Microbacterium lacus]|uniref:DUF4062 domain-containing protein n=1 Tax=Microbacterium lacus TaxID=415217 RepID=UPI00384B18A6